MTRQYIHALDHFPESVVLKLQRLSIAMLSLAGEVLVREPQLYVDTILKQQRII